MTNNSLLLEKYEYLFEPINGEHQYFNLINHKQN